MKSCWGNLDGADGRAGGAGRRSRAVLPAAVLLLGRCSLDPDTVPIDGGEESGQPLDGARMKVLLTILILSVSTSWAAPKDDSKRPETPNDSRHQSVLNPLHPGKESLRALQDYLKNAGQVDGDADAMTREQALLLLFALHDYDKSGHLDGLEFMWLLSELASQQADGQPGPDLVVLTVDSILEAQDLNQDGMLEPSELLLAAHQDQALSEEHGIVHWALPELDGEADRPPDPPGQQSTAEVTATLETFHEEHGKIEVPSLSPPEGRFDQEDPVNISRD